LPLADDGRRVERLRTGDIVRSWRSVAPWRDAEALFLLISAIISRDSRIRSLTTDAYFKYTYKNGHSQNAPDEMLIDMGQSGSAVPEALKY